MYQQGGYAADSPSFATQPPSYPYTHSLSPSAIPYVPAVQQQYESANPYVPSIQGPYENPAIAANLYPQTGMSNMRQNAQLWGPSIPVGSSFSPGTRYDNVHTPAPYARPRTFSQRGATFHPSDTGSTQRYGSGRTGEGTLIGTLTLKAARTSMERMVSSMRPKGEEGAPIFIGVLTGEPLALSFRSDPVSFVHELTQKMQVEDGGVWKFPHDQLCRDGHVRPVADALTPLRVECLSKLIPQSLATRVAMVPGTWVNTFLINGTRLKVPFEQVTITDWCRLFVSELATAPVGKQAAKRLLKQITLHQHEAWASASARLILHVRAAEVEHSRPYLSEDQLHWRFMPEDKLIRLLERTRKLFMPAAADFNALESYMVSTVSGIKNQVTMYPIHATEPLSPAMITRGNVVKAVHTSFVDDLTNRVSTFYTAQELIVQSNSRSAPPPFLGAISHKRPLDPQPSLGRKKPVTFTRESLLGALQGTLAHGGGESEYTDPGITLSRDDVETILAAFSNRPGSTPGKSGTPFNRGERYSRRTRSEPQIPEEGANRGEKGPRRTTRFGPPLAGSVRQLSAELEQEEELPEPGDNEDTIFKALQQLKICFYHAKGLTCPHTTRPQGCKYRHDERVVSFGYYKEKPVTQASLAAIDMQRAYGEHYDAASDDTNGTSTTRQDTPEPEA